MGEEHRSSDGSERDKADKAVEFEDTFVTTADGVKIHTWLMLHSGKEDPALPRPTIIYFHGNAANMGFREYF